jgi:hypothetical protein
MVKFEKIVYLPTVERIMKGNGDGAPDTNAASLPESVFK